MEECNNRGDQAFVSSRFGAHQLEHVGSKYGLVALAACSSVHLCAMMALLEDRQDIPCCFLETLQVLHNAHGTVDQGYTLRSQFNIFDNLADLFL